MRGVLIRIGVLAVLNGLIPLAVAGLTWWNDPYSLDAAISGVIFTALLVVVMYCGWAVRDGYRRRFGAKGPLVWAAIAVVSSLVLFVAWVVAVGSYNDPFEMIGWFAVLAGTLATLSAVSWFIGRAIPEGSFDNPREQAS